jgi:hypothetical protein
MNFSSRLERQQLAIHSFVSQENSTELCFVVHKYNRIRNDDE